MTPQYAFNAANSVALAGWISLIVLPRSKLLTDVLVPVVIPSLLAVAYAILLAGFFDPAGFSNFATVEGLASLQGNGNLWLVTAGWLHYLAFDLFVGAWEVRTARSEGISHWAIVPSLLLTFMAGPAGYLLFLITRFALKKRLAAS